MINVLIYIDTAAMECSAEVEQGESNCPLGSNWQMSRLDPATVEEAAAMIATWRKEMEKDGYVWVGSNTSHNSRF